MSEAPMNASAAKKASGWSRFWRGVWLFLLWVIRLIIAIGGGVLLGFAIFYVAYVGVPQFYSQVLSPIQVHTAQIAILQEDLRSTQASLNSDLRAASDEIRTLRSTVNQQETTINVLQTALQSEKENREQLLSLLQDDQRKADATLQLQGISLDQLKVALADASTQAQGATDKLAAELSSTSDTLSSLSNKVTALSETVDSSATDIATLQKDQAATAADAQANAGGLDALKVSISTLDTNLSAMSASVGELQTLITMPITLADRFERQLVLMSAWEEILKARINLLDKNNGLASQSLSLAYADIARFISLSTDLSDAQLSPIQERIQGASTVLDADPFTAAQELEIIWHQLELLLNVPVQPTVVAPAEAVAPTEVATPTEASATPEATATAEVTTTPEATVSPTEVSPTPEPSPVGTPTPGTGG